ncbi:MAG: hypothetical protein QOK15_3489 [Nocardioidaceae bacterium]|nr:hypothetical protein [Nocardioidaceae bacterium]
MFLRSLMRPVVVALATLVPAVALMGPAQAEPGGCGGGAGVLTVHVSDSTPAAGQRIAVHGKFAFFGMSTANKVVKVQARQHGEWTPIKGARVLTSANGHYRLHLVLGQSGKRHLRVVGVGQDPDPNLHQKFTLTVG